LVKDYDNKWVAIFKKKVISTNEDLGKVEEDVKNS
jgi:hypothetical protein